MIEITKDILKQVYPPRPPEAHKYDFGQLVIIGGSRFYSGAPAFNALAAFRAGVDMVRVIAPERAANIISSFAPDLAAYPLEGDYVSERHLSTILSLIESANVVTHGKVALLIGAGMGRTEEVQDAILKIIKEVDIPMILDADAIHAVANKKEVVIGKRCLFTPHDFEFFTLTGVQSKGKEREDRAQIVKDAAARLGAVILLKGMVDMISDGEEVYANRTGNSYMTKGGTGDILAGICGSLVAQGRTLIQAACAGAYISGRAGDIAAARLRQSLLASDIIGAISEVIQEETLDPRY